MPNLQGMEQSLETARILIVDDNREFCRLMRCNLALWQGLEVVGEAADGWCALRMVEELMPDVVLMDIEMKGMDGLKCTERIKAVYPCVRVLLFTIYDSRKLRERGRRAGADALVRRDTSVEVLIDIINGSLGVA